MPDDKNRDGKPRQPRGFRGSARVLRAQNRPGGLFRLRLTVSQGKRSFLSS